MKKIKGGVCAPAGFLAGGLYSGVKKSGRKDLGIIFSEVPAAVAAVFTTNTFKAAPILISQPKARRGIAQAIVANSGNANCATGKSGLEDAHQMCDETAGALGISANKVLVTSTGSIGKPLQMDKIVPGIRKLAAQISKDGGGDAADSILTTDTFRKEIAFEVEFTPDGAARHARSLRPVIKIGGIAKGSGMIHPNMATMHAFITTDAKISRALLQKMLQAAVADTFNMITVDRETSTNDCVFVLANGLSGVEIKPATAETNIFESALREVCRFLAIEIARDGEGATKLLEIKVSGAINRQSARLAARSVGGSDLVKAAFYGGDPNFGRIVSAAGESGAKFDPDKIDLKIQGVPLVKNGCGLVKNMAKAAAKLKSDKIIIDINFNQGEGAAVAWGCDLSYDYVKINAKYHT